MMGRFPASAAVIFASALFTTTATAQEVAHVFRLNSNGSIDTSFGTNGHFFENASGSVADQIYDVAPTSGGKFLFAGLTERSTGRHLLVGRVNADGTADTTFSGDGFSVANFTPTTNEYAFAVANSGGKAIVAGVANGNMAVARFTSTGILDSTFSGDGKVEINFPGWSSLAESIAVQSDGKIVVAGWASPGDGGGNTMAVARLNTDGTLDSTFHGDGKRTIIFTGVHNVYGRDVALMPVGTFLPNWIVIGGTATTTADVDQMAVAMVMPDGELDVVFDGDGKKVFAFPGSTRTEGASIATDGAARVIIGGTTTISGNSRFAVVRMDDAGAFDTSFSDDGFAALSFSECTLGEGIEQLVVTSGGNIAAAGPCALSLSDIRAAVGRLDVNGDPVTSFSGDGKVVINAVGPSNFTFGIAFGSSDKLVVGGFLYP